MEVAQLPPDNLKFDVVWTSLTEPTFDIVAIFRHLSVLRRIQRLVFYHSISLVFVTALCRFFTGVFSRPSSYSLWLLQKFDQLKRVTRYQAHGLERVLSVCMQLTWYHLNFDTLRRDYIIASRRLQEVLP